MKQSKSERSTAARSPAVFSTGFWTLSCTRLPEQLLLVPFLLWGAWLPRAAQPHPRVGLVSGEAEAVYLLTAKNAKGPPAYAANGYEQRVTGRAGAWTVFVRAEASPLRVRQPFTPGRLPASLVLPPKAKRSLETMLSGCQRADEAVDAVFLFLRTRLRYVTKLDFTENASSVLEKGRASCIGMTNAAAAILGSLGVPCRPVVGILLPDSLGPEPYRLQGAALHAWLEVTYPRAGRVLCDPLRSTNWISQRYIVLRVGEGLKVGDLERYRGGAVALERQRDRIFYEPPAGVPCLLWRRPSFAPAPRGLITGKALGERDQPVTGRATLTSGASSVSMELWEGNFFFTGLVPGHYSLRIEDGSGLPLERSVVLRPMDKRSVIFYSPTRGRRGHRRSSG